MCTELYKRSQRLEDRNKFIFKRRDYEPILRDLSNEEDNIVLAALSDISTSGSVVFNIAHNLKTMKRQFILVHFNSTYEHGYNIINPISMRAILPNNLLDYTNKIKSRGMRRNVYFCF